MPPTSLSAAPSIFSRAIESTLGPKPKELTPLDRLRAIRRYFSLPLPDDIHESISGNADRAVKELPVKLLSLFHSYQNGFAYRMGDNMRMVEVSRNPCVDEPGQLEAKVVCEIEVTEDMIDGDGFVSVGFLSWLIDEGSTVAYAVAHANDPDVFNSSVSLAIDSTFHSRAELGTTLRVVNTSKSWAPQDTSCATEIWDSKYRRLVASGRQSKMNATVKHKL